MEAEAKEERKRKVDRRHGKRPLPPNEPEEKEEERVFSRYTAARADQDASAVVSALAHVISSSSSGVGVGVGRSKPVLIHPELNPAIAGPASGSMERELSQPSEEQGMGTTFFFRSLKS